MRLTRFRRRRSLLACFAAAGAMSLASCAATHGHAAASSSSRSSVSVHTGTHSPADCGDGTLTLAYDPAILFQASGDRGETYRVTNHGPIACRLAGYPQVTMRGRAGALLPFRYTDGHSQFVTGDRPEMVTLRPGQPAYIGVAKYRCDPVSADAVSEILVLLPGQRTAIPVPTPPRRRGAGPTFQYCTGGPQAPGNTVGLSPVVARAEQIQQ